MPPPCARRPDRPRAPSAMAAPTGDHQRVSQTSGRAWSQTSRAASSKIAGEADHHQRPEERPVLAPVLRPVEIRIARRAVRPRVVELRRLQPAAPIHHVEEPAEHRDAGDVEYQREDEIELPVPEADAEQGLEDVVLQGDRGGAEEQQARNRRRSTGAPRPPPHRAARRCADRAPSPSCRPGATRCSPRA